MEVYQKLLNCFKSIENKIPFKPELALVLGSGLGAFADKTEIKGQISYNEIEDFPVSTAPGHKGRFVFSYIDGVPSVIMQGRIHYYEGYPIEDVVLPIRLMGLMGAKVLFLTNAAGGVNKSFKAGDFMLIEDHIGILLPSPLIGKNINELGVRFPDMSEVYNNHLKEIILNTAKNLNIHLQKGVYMQFTGPAYETPQEVKAAGILGADAVGMSTAVEALAANHMGIKVCGISCISNMAAGITKNRLTAEEVLEAANSAAPIFEKLVTKSIAAIGKEALTSTAGIHRSR